MRFLNETQIESIREKFGTPTYVYDQRELETAAQAVLAFPVPCRLVGRFAMKALPTAEILRLFAAQGLHFDASSGSVIVLDNDGQTEVARYNFYHAWPCKWYVPEMAADQSGMAIEKVELAVEKVERG